MAVFHGQAVDFVGLIGDTLESPLVVEGESSNVEIGSDECLSLGPKCAKIAMVDNSSFLAITDNELLANARDKISIGIAYHGIVLDTPIDWGDYWTIALQFFSLGMTAPVYGACGLLDGLCRAYFNETGHARVIEPEDHPEAVERCFEVENNGDYFILINFRRNYPETGTSTLRLRVTVRGTDTVLGEKTWTIADAATRS